jgi:hypothetical protein
MDEPRIESMADRTTVDLGPGWQVTASPEGGLDLCVAQRRRGYVVGSFAILALLWLGRSSYALTTGGPLPLGASLPVTIAIGLLLSALLVWVSFASERWRFARNCLEHRVGIGRWSHVRRFADATLEIVGHRDQRGRPYHRLFAVCSDRRHFLLERRLPELSAWANLAAKQTGWPRRDDGDLG